MFYDAFALKAVKCWIHFFPIKPQLKARVALWLRKMSPLSLMKSKSAIILPRMGLWESITVRMKACDIQGGIGIIGWITAWLQLLCQTLQDSVTFPTVCLIHQHVHCSDQSVGRGGGSTQHVKGGSGWIFCTQKMKVMALKAVTLCCY